MQNRKATQLFHTGEDLAVKYLSAKGYQILCRNFRTDTGELDIIATIDDNLVFVEVKTRSNHSIKLALMSINHTKRKRLTLTAQRYLNLHPDYVKPRIRFDVIILLFFSNTDTYRIEHLIDAFQPVWE